MTGGEAPRHAGLRRVAYYYVVVLGCAEILGGVIMLLVGGGPWSLLLVGSGLLIAGTGYWVIRKWKNTLPAHQN